MKPLTWTAVITDAQHNAKGQIASIAYSNGPSGLMSAGSLWSLFAASAFAMESKAISVIKAKKGKRDKLEREES